MSARVSIIILNYNCRKYLEPCLVSLSRLAYSDYEMIIVDNNSSDGSAKYLEQFLEINSKVRVVFNRTNFGYARGNNLGAFQANGDYLFFLNPDTRIDPNCLKEMIKMFEDDSTVGAIQSLLLRAGFNPPVIDCSGGFIDRFGWSYKRDYDRQLYSLTEDLEIFYAMGAALLVRKDQFVEIGGFDEEMFLYHEDIDLCWRYRLSGRRVIIAPKALVYHLGGAAETESRNGKIIYYREKNHLITLYKNYANKRLILYLPIVYLLYILSFFYFFFLNGDKVKGFAYLQAIWWSLSHMPLLISKRFKARPKRKVSDSAVEKYFLGNIVVGDILRKIVIGYLRRFKPRSEL